MTVPLKVGFVPASRGIFDQELAVKVRDDVIEAIRGAGMEVIAPDDNLTGNGLVQTPEEARKTGELFEKEGVCGVVVGALNFGNEVPAALAALWRSDERPVMLFGVGEDGELTPEASRRDSFCGLISIATALRHRESKFVFPRRAVCFPTDAGFRLALFEFGNVCRAVTGVRGAVYGLFGPRPEEFETCAFDELSLLRKLGIRVVPVPLTTLFSVAEAVPVAVEREIVEDMEGSADCSGVSEGDLAKMARLEAALESMIEEHGMGGLALQCWTSIQDDYGVSPCFVMSRLTDRGTPCACEVDIHGTLSMHLLSLVAGSTAGLADWNNRHYRAADVFSAWHCGVFPLSLCSGEKRLSYHNILADSTGTTEGKFGTVESRLDDGPVTMTRVTEHPRDTWPVLIAEGDVVDVPGSPPGSHGWVRVSDLDRLYAEVLRGFPHHTAITGGHVGGALMAAAYFLGLDPVTPLSLEPAQLEIGPESGVRS